MLPAIMGGNFGRLSVIFMLAACAGFARCMLAGSPGILAGYAGYAV
jgi:hypothetical protein